MDGCWNSEQGHTYLRTCISLAVMNDTAGAVGFGGLQSPPNAHSSAASAPSSRASAPLFCVSPGTPFSMCCTASTSTREKVATLHYASTLPPKVFETPIKDERVPRAMLARIFIFHSCPHVTLLPDQRRLTLLTLQLQQA
jgi:hypothetical protein